MTPHWGYTIILCNSSQQFPSLRGAFGADTLPFKGTRLAWWVASGTTEKQGHCQVCHTRLGGSKVPSKTTYLESAFLNKTHFFAWILIVKKPTE